MPQRPEGFTQDDEIALIDSFTVGGSCGCDGALDDGCPNCDEAQFAAWWAQRVALKRSRFERSDVV